MQWQSSEQLKELLCELVSWESETFSIGEKQFPIRLREKLATLSYFTDNPNYLQTIEVDQGRSFLSAFYRKEENKKTVVLISHFDTVPTEEYGSLQPLATQPKLLTQAFLDNPGLLNEAAQADLKKGDYLFGRGVMDMKMGLTLHMHLIEKAIENSWDTNLLLITVPDEEVNSAGMRSAVKHIANLKKELDLDIQLFLNSEPSFSQDPTDLQEYIYTGTIGKIMPAVLCYGKETHVGEPMKGINATFMNSYLTTEMEFNLDFLETVYGEITPLPVSLEQKDLKLHYSTQTPYQSYALYNVFLMKRSAEEIFEIFEKTANDAMEKCQAQYEKVCQSANVQPIGKIQTISYKKLYEYSIKKLGESYVEELIADVMKKDDLDDRQKSIYIADQLMIHSKELAPAVVLLFAPPYYPPANSKDDTLVQDLVELLLKEAQQYDIPLREMNYFNGLCDLSYCQNTSDIGWHSYEENTPVWNRSYTIPFEEMKEISAPVLNVGPFGKDAHQISERLHTKSAFIEMPELITKVIQHINSSKEFVK